MTRHMPPVLACVTPNIAEFFTTRDTARSSYTAVVTKSFTKVSEYVETERSSEARMVEYLDDTPAQEKLDATVKFTNENTDDGTNNLRPFSEDGSVNQAG